MKKVLFAFIVVLSLMTIGVSAANVGDKISEAVYSDITAYINNYPMPCYVIDGYAVIIAEDLKNYSCDVYFDESTRTLSITKAQTAVFNPSKVYKTTRKTGEFFTDVLYTDIQAYVNNSPVKSFNVNGKTMIVIDEFGKYMDGYEWDESNRAAKAYMTDKPVSEFEIPETAVIQVFEQSYYSYPPKTTCRGTYDLNFDGKKDTVQVTVNSIDAKTQYMKISVNGKEKKLDTPSLLSLEAVYICDINPYDEYKDIAVLTTEESVVLRIFKADGNNSIYQFNIDNGYGQPEISDFCYIGFVFDPELATNHDGSVVIQKNFAATAGRIAETYTLNENGILIKTVPASYRVDNSALTASNADDSMSYTERTMWQNGYLKAHNSFYNNGISINKGEYFRVLYYNGTDYIYIEKENGNGGWIYLSENIYELNPFYFHGID